MAEEKQLNDRSVTEHLNAKSDNNEDMLESVLSHVGDMGLYQKLLFVGMLPFGCFYAWVYFAQMFITATPQNHWCKVPELGNLSIELRRNLTAPMTATGEWERCMMFGTNWSRVLETLTPPPAGTPTVPCQHGWEFLINDIPYETLVSERGWVCDSASYVPLAQTVFFAGAVLGGVIFGWVADKFGRVPALIGANVIGGIGGIATTFTTGVWDFIFCRFIVGISFDNCFMILYILVLEYVGARYRTLVGNASIALFFGGGAVTLPWIAYVIADWRRFIWVTSLPMFFVLAAPWLLPESVRWLVSVGRVKDAVKVLKKFETINGTRIPDHVLEDFMVSTNKEKLSTKESFFNLFKSTPLCRTIIVLALVYSGCSIVFDSLVRLSDSFGLDFFVTFTFTSATEIPAILILAFVLDRWGRRHLTWLPLSLAGMFIFIAIFVPKGVAQASLAVLARFFMNMCITAAVQWGTELLPTPFRASGSSALHVTGYLATAITPYIVYSERYCSILPLTILAVTAFIAAGLSLTLPETTGLPMPQTVADSVKIIRGQALCGKPEDSDGHLNRNCC